LEFVCRWSSKSPAKFVNEVRRSIWPLWRNHPREELRSWCAFMLLTRAPGQAPVGFDEVLVGIGGAKRIAHCVAMAAPHFAGCFVVPLRVGP